MATKLNAPRGRGQIIDRATLLERLRSGRTKLILVDAPAGWGKTTLLSAWAAAPNESRAFAWLSLDVADNDPVRFWTYVVKALQTVFPDVGAKALTSLLAPGGSVADLVLPQLINDLATREPVVIVLDDYHLIAQREITEAVAVLVEHLPPSVSLVLATRSDPRLPLGRLRARGDMLEVRAEELRFSAEEAGVLLNEVVGFELFVDDIRRIHKRTEGWAAGLCLAALSLKNQPDTAGFIDNFAGDDRHIVDFLGVEVLGAQRSQVRDFLLRTSILERLSGPLCDAVLDVIGSAQTLEEVERSNLFLVPLDRTRTWYRYHQLFGELLEHELRRTDPDLVPLLHARASDWHRDAGSISAAMRHATLAGDTTTASRLITDHWYGYLQRGRLETVAAWLDALGNEVVADDPRLCLTRAWLGINTGRLDELDQWIQAAERAAAGGRVQEGASMVETGTASLRAIHRYMSGDVDEAIIAGARALELERKGQSSPWHPVGCPVLGIALFWRGRNADAKAELEQAVREAVAGGNNLSQIHALGGLASIAAAEGKVTDAGGLAATAVEVSEQNDLTDHWATTLSLVVQGRELEQQGQVAAAAEVVERGTELSDRGIARLEIAAARLALARIKRTQGDPAAALALVRDARRTIERCPEPGILADMLARSERALRLVPKGEDSPTPAGELSDRENEVLHFLPSELSQKEIADALFVSFNTVKSHMRTIFRKLEVTSRTDAVTRARERGLL